MSAAVACCRRAALPGGWSRPLGRRGFTLIELMITVAIVGILAAIAYPAYQDSILKGRRAEGRAALLNLLQQQERYYTQTGSYLAFEVGATGDSGTSVTTNGTVTIPFKTTSGDSTDFAYRLGAAVCSDKLALNECVLLSAVPRMSDEAAGTLTLDSAGYKSCTGKKVGVPKVCW